MSKEKTLAVKSPIASGPSFFGELFHFTLYKRNQGRITRQVTFAAIAISVALAAYSMSNFFQTSQLVMGETLAKPILVYGLPFLFLAVGWWIGFRAVCYARFADFLISVEAEMNKVSWPSRPELFRASIVVVVVIIVMAAVLFGFDLFWRSLFSWIEII